MDDSPFRRIVLPALLASSAGFAVLTWPLASDQGDRVAAHLPSPLSRWVDSALVTDQHKEFSIRYIGLAILSSVAIGVGTAEVMRSRQTRVQRHKNLLNQMLAEDDRPLAETVEMAGGATDVAGAMAEAFALGADGGLAALDWAGFAAEAPPSNLACSGLLATATEEHQIYQIQGVDQRYRLALQVEGQYYGYYRRRPDLGKTQLLLKRLHRQGKTAIATRDGVGYIVWLHQPDRPQQLSRWAGPVAAG